MNAKTAELLKRCRELVRDEWEQTAMLSRARYLKDLLADIDAAIAREEGK